MNVNTRDLSFVKFNNQVMNFVNYNGVEVYSAGYWLTKTGYPCTLPNSLGKDLRNYKIYGNSIQGETPTPDNPVEIGTVGEHTINLFNPKAELEKLNNYLGFTINLTDFTFYMKLKENKDVPQGVYFGLRVYISETAGNITWFVLNGGLQYSCKSWQNQNYKTEIIVYGAYQENWDKIVDSFDILLVEGVYTVDNIPNYEPYGYKIPVLTGGKNLFDIHITPETPITELDVNITQSITVSAQSTDVVVSAPSWKVRVDYQNGKTDFVGDASYSLPFPRTFNATEDNPIVKIIYRGAYSGFQSGMYDIQIEYGTVATDYEPYVEPIINNIYLDEPLRKVGDYADYIDFENQKIIRQIKKAIISSLNFSALSNDGGYYRYETSGIADKLYTNTYSTNVLSNVLQTISYKQKVDNSIAERHNFNLLRILTSQYSTLEELNTAIGNEEVYYVLNTPQEETIKVPKIPTIKGTTIISTETTTESSNLKVVYKSSRKERGDKEWI